MKTVEIRKTVGFRYKIQFLKFEGKTNNHLVFWFINWFLFKIQILNGKL
jgi:hypothetical protein